MHQSLDLNKKEKKKKKRDIGFSGILMPKAYYYLHR